MPRVNRLAPYKPQISVWLSEGNTYTEIAEKFLYEYDLDVTEGAICMFVKKNGLKNLFAEKKANVPRCNICSDCTVVYKANCDEKTRLCTASNKLIRGSVLTSPDWCPLREVENGNVRC